MQAWIYRHYHKSSDCFEYQKIIPTKIKPLKKILAKFATRNRKFQTQKILSMEFLESFLAVISWETGCGIGQM